MQKRLLRWELIGFAFTGAVGTLLHFVYEWTGGNPLIAAFCAVNESTWEHMKLLFVPFFLFTMVQFIVFAEPLRSFFAAKAASILLGLLAIPVLFYSLGGMFGKTPDWVNIAIFFLADALLYLMSFRLLTRGALRGGARQTLLHLAEQSRQEARTLAALYYLTTGQRAACEPVSPDAPACLAAGLRRQYERQLANAATYRALAEQTPAHAETLTCLADGSQRHARTLVCVLQDCL